MPDKSAPQPLASLPGTPVSEEDISRPRIWEEVSTAADYSPPGTARSWKGKGKQVATEDNDENEDEDGDEKERETAGADPAARRYPPMNDDDAETRRVEENLRLWEQAERQRRKAVRESAPLPNGNSGKHTPGGSGASVAGSSIFSGSFWGLGRTKSQRGADSNGWGTHAALQSRDSLDALPMDNIDLAGPISSPLPSRLARISRSRSTERGAITDADGLSENPFIHPSETAQTKSERQPAVMEESTTPLPTPNTLNTDSQLNGIDDYMLLPKSHSKSKSVPPPEPLNLPPPRTPPPLTPTTSPPLPTAPPTLDQRYDESRSQTLETRWWHEWLCGCGEGADRGGDNQAGRTNPFE